MSSNLARDIQSIKLAGSVEELTRRYRKLCKIYHPDLQKATERAAFQAHMQNLNEAYQSALKRFNIFTFKHPNKPNSWQPPKDTVINVVQKTAYEARTNTSQQPSKTGSAPNTAAVQALASAMATLKRTRTFFSLKGTDDPDERRLYQLALYNLHDVRQRFPESPEAQDAHYYMAITYCNLKNYSEALQCFTDYQEKYPNDERSDVFHFYAGLCHHRLGNFSDAVREYGYFLISKQKGMYHHFAGLVVTYKEAAEREIVPKALPYG